MRARWIGLVVLLWSGAVAAEAPAAGASARARFEAGLAAIARGELEQGLREFEAAYAIQPRYAVLFNIGQAQAALGRPLDAIASFERFLAQGGQQIPAARRLEVSRLIEQSRKLTGALILRIAAPNETRVWLDGKPLTSDALSKPLPLMVGEHTLLHSYGRDFPIEQKVRVEPERTTEVVIAAPAMEPSAEAPAAPAPSAIAVTCKVAGLEVEVAGKPAGRTPLARPVSVSPGSVRVTFSRAGYEPIANDIFVSAGSTSHVRCALPLARTRESLERDRAATHKRILGWSFAGAGLGSFAASAAVYGWNQGRYEDWNANRTAEDPMLSRAVSIQRADDAAVGLLVLGAGLSALATWTLLAGD